MNAGGMRGGGFSSSSEEKENQRVGRDLVAPADLLCAFRKARRHEIGVGLKRLRAYPSPVASPIDDMLALQHLRLLAGQAQANLRRSAVEVIALKAVHLLSGWLEH